MKKIALIFVFSIAVSCLFVGCGGNTIQFNPESKFSNMMKNVQNDKPKVYQSSGVAIYKDEDKANSNKESGGFNIKF